MNPRLQRAYRRERYFPDAITSSDGACTLYMTRSPGASSTIVPNQKVAKLYLRGGYAAKLEVVETAIVPSRTLDGFWDEAKLGRIDFFKRDTQGNEFDILSGSRHLRDIGIVQTEVEFVELYQGQKLHHHIADAMYRAGFEQIDLEIDRRCRRGMNRELVPGRQLVWADASFLNRGLQDRASLNAQMLTLLALGYHDIAWAIARKGSLVSDAQLLSLTADMEADLARQASLISRLRRLVERITGVHISRA